jgi:hypothetical protein
MRVSQSWQGFSFARLQFQIDADTRANELPAVVVRVQGDQMGQIFAHWVIVFFGLKFVFINYRRSQNICSAYSRVKRYVVSLKQMGWAT